MSTERDDLPLSYRDVTVYIDGVIYKPSQDYTLELICNRAGGWRLFRISSVKSKLIGGEFDSKEMCITVGSMIILGTPPDKARRPELKDFEAEGEEELSGITPEMASDIAKLCERPELANLLLYEKTALYAMSKAEDWLRKQGVDRWITYELSIRKCDTAKARAEGFLYACRPPLLGPYPACPKDTNGDGDCGNPHCPFCGWE